MPRPEERFVTFSIDGLEVRAPENAMLVDGAKYGDVEIPVFCYEPKLGQPVGACRMCLVEIEGIPKLQTACSTPVKDGMVVHTQTQRVREAQQAVVEFLLINHPLDCPVCDKGGECPLQDISFGWGGGRSRFIEPKRHFRKPLELSPLVAIDRERCILCYRCVRFSQEIAEDYQLVLLERGAHSFVGTFDGHPYVAPFSGNIIELCPVGALTSTAYRFRARPWDIEGAGSICTLCPSQCNVTLTVRDDKVLRVLARDHAEVDDGWLCDKGRFAYQTIHIDERITSPMVRDGGELRPVSWERALGEAAKALERAKGGRAAALAGGEATNEEGHLLARIMREGVGSPHLDSREGGSLPLELHRALAAPALQAGVPDLEFAHAVLVVGMEPVDDAPILDLRIRKGVRRQGVRLAVATDRPSSLDPNAEVRLRFRPGSGEALLAALDAALTGAGTLGDLAAAAGTDAEAIRSLARLLRDAGEDVVILYGERLLSGPRGADAARALLNVAARLGLAEREGAGLLGIPAGANGRGLAEVGFLPNAGPGYADPPEQGREAREIAMGLADGELTTLYLLRADPLRTHPDRALWKAALDRATAVIAHESLLTETVREHATVVFPAQSYAEKEGTVTHPDGRVQRLRMGIGPVGESRAEWWVLDQIARRLGLDLGVLTSPMASAQVFDTVPFYAGLTLEELATGVAAHDTTTLAQETQQFLDVHDPHAAERRPPRPGVRWPLREQASALPAGELGPFELPPPPAPEPAPDGALRLGTFRSIWAAPEVEAAPALRFLAADQHVELAPGDAERLGLADGDRAAVAVDGREVHARVVLRDAVPPGNAFLQTGTATDNATALLNGGGELVEVRKAP